MIELTKDLTLHRDTLAREIAKKLSGLIQNGSLPPGTRLIEADLSNLLGVSRGPLREALRILETDSLIESIPRKGCHVAPVSRQDAYELYSLRVLMEPEATRLATLKSTSTQLERLGDIVGNLNIAAETDDFDRIAKIESSFHQYIWEISEHKRLKNILCGMLPQVRRYISLQTALFEIRIVGISDHEKIFNQMVDRNADKAAQLMKNHLEEVREAAIKNLPDEIE